MNLNKLKIFGALQDEVMNLSEGNIPLVSFYQDDYGISVHNPSMDVTGRFEVDPVKEYGNEALVFMEKEIEKIEKEMGVLVEEMLASDLRLYLGGKFYQGKTPGSECFEKIGFEDDVMFYREDEEALIDDSLNFYVPFFAGIEELLPEAAIKLVTPVDYLNQLNLYANYDMLSKSVNLLWTLETGQENYSGKVKVPEKLQESLIEKMDAYVKTLGEESLEKMVSEVINEQIWDALEKAVNDEWYARPDENGDYQIEISADYRETNEGLLKNAYDNRESVELKSSIIDEITESYEEAISEYEYALLDKAGLGVDSPYHEQAREILWEKISFSPDYDHFMNDDMKVNLLLATDWEQNVEFTDIKEELFTQISSGEYTSLVKQAENAGEKLPEPDNALVWLIKQQGYSLDDLSKAYEAYTAFLNDNYYPNGNPRDAENLSYAQKIKKLQEEHGKFLVSVCEELDNQSYSMGCLTVLVKSSLSEYSELFERNADSNELVPKEIVLPKEVMLGIHDPWNGAGSLLGIELEKELILPNNMIYDSEIEGVKRNYGWTVDQISGLVGTCWKESKGVRVVQNEVKKPSVDEMIHGAAGRAYKDDNSKSQKNIDMDMNR